MIKKVVWISQISELDSILVKKVAPDGNLVVPDFELTYLEFGKYLLIIKE